MRSIEIFESALTIASSNTTASTVINHFATRQRNRKVENVTHLVKVCGNGTTRQSVVRVFQQLEASGFGEFKCGRREHDSRFIWNEV